MTNVLILGMIIVGLWVLLALIQNIGGAERFRRVTEWPAWRGSQRGIDALAKSPGESAITPDLGSIPSGSIDPDEADAVFEAWGDNVPDPVWDEGVVPICDATLKLHSQTGWVVEQGSVMTPIHGPVRVRVLSVGMKAVEYDSDGSVLKVAYGYGPDYARVRKLADDFPKQAAYGPEYEVELLDRGVMARYFAGSRVAKAAVGGTMRPGAEVVLGCKKVGPVFLPTCWRQLDNAEA